MGLRQSGCGDDCLQIEGVYDDVRGTGAYYPQRVFIFVQHTRSEDGEDSLNMLRKEVKALSQVCCRYPFNSVFTSALPMFAFSSVSCICAHAITDIQSLQDDLFVFPHNRSGSCAPAHHLQSTTDR